MTRRNGAAAAALALALALAAGCGGGGGDSADAGDAAPPVPAVPVATGASPAESATQAIAALGVPGAVEPGAVGASLAGFETFGAPHDAFAQQVRDGSGSGSEATAGAGPPPGPPPINGDPFVAVPGGTGSIPTGGSGGEPGTGAVPPGEQPPVQSPVAYEADFDISGEPVVAREGDAIPPDTQQFVVDRVAAGEVTLKLSGGLLPDGTDSVTLKVGESITLFNATAGRTYRIKLVAVQRG